MKEPKPYRTLNMGQFTMKDSKPHLCKLCACVECVPLTKYAVEFHVVCIKRPVRG